MYDIAIVGAGPAGANLARLIGEKYKVVLIDKRDLENEKKGNQQNKCCGGLLSPDAQKIIAKLHLALPKDILVDPQLFAVRTMDFTNHIERLYQRFYFNMDPEKFDKWLVSLVPLSVDRKFHCYFRGFRKMGEGYEIRYLCDGHEKTLQATVIVGADGALSPIRKSMNLDIGEPQKYIAIQEWYECPSPMPYFTAIFDEEVSDFYSWLIPKENYLLLGAALRPRENTWEKYEILKEKLIRVGFEFDKKIKTEGAFINRPKKISQFFLGKDHIVLVGEAAGAISPSSAEGISYALKTSFYLAESLEIGIEGFLERYKRKACDIRGNLLLKNLKSPAMYHPLLRKMAMKSGIQSIT